LVYEKNLSPDDWFHAVLDILWINIVKPVIQFLQIKVSYYIPRSFPFPIHASEIRESIQVMVVSDRSIHVPPNTCRR
jgi:hypothetical protein